MPQQRGDEKQQRRDKVVAGRAQLASSTRLAREALENMTATRLEHPVIAELRAAVRKLDLALAHADELIVRLP